MTRLVLFLFSFILAWMITNIHAQASSHSNSCTNRPLTFENWRGYTKVTPKPIFSKGHGNEWVEIYVDDLAKAPYLAATAPYPECATIVKAHYSDESGTNQTSNLAIMVKMPPGYDPENADWWYGKYDTSGTKAKMQGKLFYDCIACHRGASETDYLFSKEVMAEINKE